MIGGDYMGSLGGFYKGEKKKQKKGKDSKQPLMSSSAPVFTLPEVIIKKKNEG